MSTPLLGTAHLRELTAATMYEILQLRAAVFIVEQNCVYQDLDDRDLEPGTLHYWIEDGGPILATARLLREADGVSKIGRVCTATSARSRGFARRLVAHIVATEAGTLVLDAQTYLTDWYASFGFVVDGEEFLEDNIPHTPMRLERP